MQYTTEEYREEMKAPFRGKSSVYVYIGLINNDAQRSAHITSTFSGDESGLYVNSSTAYAGVTSKENDGHITFAFEGTENNIAGLTITFIEKPTSITVTNGSKTGVYGVDSLDFLVDDGYENCSYLTITPDSGKLKLKSIIFGIGLQFTDRQLISTTRNNTVDHISNELPLKTFSFTVDNTLHLFNKDNPYGYSAYLQEKQEVVYNYSRELENGDIFTIKGGKVLLQSWSSSNYEAKFNCVGRLDYLDQQYYKGQYSKEGISAKTVAEDIFAVAGVSEYKLDKKLEQYLLSNPMPVCSCKEALQMLANRCMCVLSEDRDGNICILDANLPSFVGHVDFIGATEYSNPSGLFQDNSANNYATAEKEYACADGTLLFIPDEASCVDVGFVSSELAGVNGTFTNNPHIEVTLQTEYHMKDFIMNFAVNLPTSVTVELYLQGETVSSSTITEITEATTYEYDGVVDAFKITFNSAEPNQRIHLNNIQLNGVVIYELTYHELKYTPVATSLEKVSNINVHIYSFYKQGEEPTDSQKAWIQRIDEPNVEGGITVELNTQRIEDVPIATIQAEVGDNLIVFDKPFYDISSDNGTVKESGAYYAIVTVTEDCEVTVSGKEFIVTETVYSTSVHEKGEEKESQNQLIDKIGIAKAQAEWLRDYYDDDIQYSLTYRGDPVIDADDLMYLQNDFVAKNQIRIREESISTSMGMDFTCILTARRTSYQTDATTENAIVGRVKVGEVL